MNVNSPTVCILPLWYYPSVEMPMGVLARLAQAVVGARHLGLLDEPAQERLGLVKLLRLWVRLENLLKLGEDARSVSIMSAKPLASPA
jgi:hypothetical protein